MHASAAMRSTAMDVGDEVPEPCVRMTEREKSNRDTGTADVGGGG